MSNSKAVSPVITRFAPSPTGYLHIGGARTALFNWLYAKANGGKMLLRIEDTDQKRSTDSATTAIYDGLKWLGLDWDGDAVSQFSNSTRHSEIAHKLLAEGNAYYCFASSEELENMRNLAKKNSRPMRYEWRDKDPVLKPKNIKPVIRLKSPRQGQTIVEDQVQGQIVFNNENLDDMVLLRSDGTPTYMLAVVVDDHDMGVTHIIRGDDHLTNAARQMLIYQALNWDVPVMAHIPLIHGSDGAKLSKRHGALGVEAYRTMGYLPEALLNYLVRLGWSHGDDEIISTNQMVQWFNFDAIGKGASRFDFTKLEHLNGTYIRDSTDKELTQLLLSEANHLEAANHLINPLSPAQLSLLEQAMPLLKERVKTLNELASSSRFLFNQRPVSLDEKAIKFLDSTAKFNLAKLLPELERTSAWDAESLSALVRLYCDKHDLKLGKIAQPIRCAIAGTPAAPGVFEVMELLGQKETILRIADQLQTSNSQ